MINIRELRPNTLIKYHFNNPFKRKISYWEVGYVISITPKYIKISSKDPNQPQKGLIFDKKHKIRLEDMSEFKEIKDPYD